MEMEEDAFRIAAAISLNADSEHKFPLGSALSLAPWAFRARNIACSTLYGYWVYMAVIREIVISVNADNPIVEGRELDWWISNASERSWIMAGMIAAEFLNKAN